MINKYRIGIRINKQTILGESLSKITRITTILLDGKVIRPSYARNLRILHTKSVFPVFMRSNQLLLTILKHIDLHDMKILDLGTGTGILSIYCAKNGAKQVYASDINEAAVKTAKINAKLNQAHVHIRHGNLFEPFTNQQFDLILFNPPYFPASPESPTQQAFFAGTEYTLFTTFLTGLPCFLRPKGNTLITLSSLMKLSYIHSIISHFGFNHLKIGQINGLPRETITAYSLRFPSKARNMSS